MVVITVSSLVPVCEFKCEISVKAVQVSQMDHCRSVWWTFSAFPEEISGTVWSDSAEELVWPATAGTPLHPLWRYSCMSLAISWDLFYQHRADISFLQIPTVRCSLPPVPSRQ